MYGYVLSGYRVEALTNDIVVLVRIGNGSLVFLASLVIIGMSTRIIRFGWPTVVNASAEASGSVSLFLSLLSVFFGAYFVIAGNGYERLVFRRTNNPGETEAVVKKTPVLPPGMRCLRVPMENCP